MSRKYYTDSYNITSEQVRENGTIDITATVAKVGVYSYGKDSVYVGREVLSDPAWISALNGSIYTSFHDPAMFTAAKGKLNMVGAVSEAIFDEDTQSNHVKIRIWDTAAYQQIKQAGKIFLSCGYYADTSNENGTYAGQNYNHKQTKRTHCDHVAATNMPRHGHSCVLDEREENSMDIEETNTTPTIEELVAENQKLKDELASKAIEEESDKEKQCDKYTLDDVKQIIDMANAYGIHTDKRSNFSYTGIRNAILSKQGGIKNIDNLDDASAEVAFQVLKKCYNEQAQNKNPVQRIPPAVVHTPTIRKNHKYDSIISPLVLRANSNCVNGEQLNEHYVACAKMFKEYNKRHSDALAETIGLLTQKENKEIQGR